MTDMESRYTYIFISTCNNWQHAHHNNTILYYIILLLSRRKIFALLYKAAHHIVIIIDIYILSLILYDSIANQEETQK